jgi:hypothetical protein
MAATEVESEVAVKAFPAWREEVWPLLTCVLLGLLMATLPHWIHWRANQGPTWIASNDESGGYLPPAAQAFYEHPLKLTDPSLANGGATMFPAMQILPGVWLARLMGWEAGGITLGWRIWAGITVSLALYFATRMALLPRWWAVAVCGVMLTDIGVVTGRLLDYQVATMWQCLILGKLSAPFFHQWRVITPALSAPFLWLYLGMLWSACRRPSRLRVLGAGLAFGLLFPTYFYLWTAGVMALALSWICEPRQRQTLFHVGWIGALVGLPSLLMSASLKRETGVEWLQRSHKFYEVPHEFGHVPWVATVTLLAALVACWWRHRDLVPLAGLALCGWLLQRHQLISGVEIENNHWVYVSGPCQSLLVLIVLAREADILERPTRDWVRRLVASVVVFELACGVSFRALEAVRQPQARRWAAAWQQVNRQFGTARIPFLTGRAVVAGDLEFGSISAIRNNTRTLAGGVEFFSPQVSNRELNERVALDAWLRARSIGEFEQDIRGGHGAAR